jgi:PKD repeat protein
MIGVALFAVATPVSAASTIDQAGDDVFIGEEALDITIPMDYGNFTSVTWFASGTDPMTDSPSAVISIPVSSQSSYYINPTLYSGKTGNWYRWDNGATRGEVAFNVVDPSIDIKIIDQPRPIDIPAQDVTGKSIPIGHYGNFRIETNLYTITERSDYNPSTDGFTIKVQSPQGGIYTSLKQSDSVTPSLTPLDVDQDLWYWQPLSTGGVGWNTGYRDNNVRVYQDGLYKVSAECNVNGIKDNYKNPSTGEDYTGKTVSIQKSVTLESVPLTLTPSPSSLIRGDPFSVMVHGDPNAEYLVWIQYGCEKLSGLECEQPPMVEFGMEGIEKDTQYEYACACFECNGCIVNLEDVLAAYPEENNYYAIVTTNATGYRPVEFLTYIDTMPATYTIGSLLIEPDLCTEPHIPTDTSVTINLGVVDFNMYVYGDPASETYLGEKIWIRGTNTDPSGWVYLSMIGPCQQCEGVNLIGDPVVYGDPDTFTKVEVKSDNTWEYLWDTSTLKIDLGQYTIYAASKPDDIPSLEGVPCNDCEDINVSCAAWAKKPMTFLNPKIIADIHPKVLRITCCEEPDIIVSGDATGIREDECQSCPCKNAQIAYWVFGENKVAGEKYIFNTVEPECPNGAFSFNIKDDINSLRLLPGTYHVVVQHPMYNHKLDIIPDDSSLIDSQYSGWIYTRDTSKTYVVSANPVVWSKLFQIDGTGRLEGTAAYDALIAGLDNPNIDDSYLVLTFKVESNTATMADFSGIPTSGSAPLTVQFTDISVGLPPTAWLWNFGDGVGTSTVQHPSYTYQNPGTYDVTLTVTGPAGSSSVTKNGYVTVGTGPTPTVTPTPGTSEINLKSGWNFISTPKRLEDGHNTAGVVFDGVNTGGRSIFLYNAETGMWDSLSASSLVRPLDGIWIYSTSPVEIPLTFKSSGAELPPTKWVYPGWNAIGFSDTTPVGARMTLLSVNNPPNVLWTQVIGYNSATQSYEGTIFNADPSYNTLMRPTKGYWLYMNGQNPPWELAAISA